MTAQGWQPLGLVIMMTLLGGCDDDREVSVPASYDLPTEGEATGPRAEDAAFSLEVRAPTRCANTGALAPKPGKVRVNIPVSVQSRSPEELSVSPFEFALEDEKGHVARPTLASCGAPFERTRLAPGTELSAALTFDVDASGRDFVLHFQPFIIGRKPIDARVKVPGFSVDELTPAAR